jgi:hypothetical protein
MKIDWEELNKGFASSFEKKAWDGYWEQPSGPIMSTLTAVPRWAWNTGVATAKAAPAMVGAYSGAANAAANLPQAVEKGIGFLKDLPDTVGKYAPLAMGAIALMGRGGNKQNNPQPNQGNYYGGPQPIVIHNHMPGATQPMPGMLNYDKTGVGSLSKMSESNEKIAGIVSKALADAAKRRMANTAIDAAVGATPEKPSSATAEKELEIVTKYPEMAKLLEDEQNKAYLQRLVG